MYRGRLNKFIISLLIGIMVLALPLQTYAEIERIDKEYYNQILKIVEENYVDRIPKENLKGSIKDIFNNLDNHSDYYNKEEYSKLQEVLNGNFVGIGAYITEENGYIKVVRPIKNSPAEKAGLLPGDIISTVDGKITRGMTADEATKLIKGEKDTVVNLRIRSGNVTKIRNIQRKEIQMNPVYYEVIDGIGYIKLDQFTNTSYKYISEALRYMDKNNIEKIVLDLRDNPGGYLDQAINIANLLVPKGPVVHIKYKNQGIVTYNSYLDKVKYNLVVLVNENSASASEILAGAIQDRKAGKIVGVPTFGKGTVQEVITLPKGDGIKLTVAEYFSPKMRKINGKGITPHIIVENLEGEDSQLKTALELLSYLSF